MRFDDTSRRLPVRRYSIATGHPPVLMQIADQVRCATGYTLGRATVEGARQVLLPSAMAARCGLPVKPAAVAAPKQAPAEELPGSQVERLLGVLRRLGDLNQTLPGSGALAEMAQINPNYVATAFHTLASRGYLREWFSPAAGPRTERIVVLLPSGAVLRTAGAPAGIVP